MEAKAMDYQFRPYRGPGCADPSKTRQEREADLRGFMENRAACGILMQLYHQAKGIPPGVMVPAGPAFTSMIDTILDHEYPTK
jgi:hypothetical protein